jgi:hypothetical protein
VKAKHCKVEGCDKQAQGSHDGMCKCHFKAIRFPEVAENWQEVQPQPPEGKILYDGILPQSISYQPSILHNSNITQIVNNNNITIVGRVPVAVPAGIPYRIRRDK